jgi:hypothetical protein
VGEGRSFIPATFVEYVWLLDHDGFFQAVTDQDGTVVRHAITSASRKFRPKIQVAAVSGGEPEFVVRLGATRFGDLPSLDNCDEVYWWLGARRYEYRESYYCGDRGGYVDWVCSFNDAGIGPWLPLHLAVDPPPMLGGAGVGVSARCSKPRAIPERQEGNCHQYTRSEHHIR